MTITVEVWHLITLLLGFIGFLVSLGKFFLMQIDNRFAAQQQARQQHTQHWDSRFSIIEQKTAESIERTQELEREFLKSRADMPLNYVRREDWIRNQTIIESKLDGLAVRLEHLNQHGI